MKPIYLDYNATTPIDRAVAEVMKHIIDEGFGNPSSGHYYGYQSKKTVENARSQVADLLGCMPEEIIFTGCGSESNNLAIKGVAFANRHRGNHIVTSQIEHPAVTAVCKYLEQYGFEVSYAQVDEFGIVSPQDIARLIRPTTILISIMHANNEVGSIQPVAEIAEIASKHGITLHTDAAQSVGKIPVRVNDLGVDLLTVAGHKLYAPKGIGALYIRKGTNLEKLQHGADHESNMRAGTENVIHIAALGKACEIARIDLEENYTHSKKMRDMLYSGLTENLQNIKLNGHPEKRLPNTLSIGFNNIPAINLLAAMPGIAASAGAACHSGQDIISSVLVAMNVPSGFAKGTIRFSTGKYTTEQEISDAVRLVTKAVLNLQPNPSDRKEIIENEGEKKLTHFTTHPGCSCKIPSKELQQILSKLPISTDKNILIGSKDSDDAAVYRINDETAIVNSIDILTPMVDDPYQFGAIAAANSLSDIYAMGAKPLFALSFIGFPIHNLPFSILSKILEGARDKVEEAGIQIIGGHSIQDNEPKFGLAVTGKVHPDRILSNSGAKPGDVLVLTKPIGTGLISYAVNKGIINESASRRIIESMSELNNIAAVVMEQFPVNACTDITGFGLLGHLSEMTRGSGVDAEIYFNKIPIFTEAYDLAKSGFIPGTTFKNSEYTEAFVEWDESMPDFKKQLLNDAQTSGGLLISLPEANGEAFINKLVEAGLISVGVIGKVLNKGKGRTFVS